MATAQENFQKALGALASHQADRDLAKTNPRDFAKKYSLDDEQMRAFKTVGDLCTTPSRDNYCCCCCCPG